VSFRRIINDALTVCEVASTCYAESGNIAHSSPRAISKQREMLCHCKEHTLQTHTATVAVVRTCASNQALSRLILAPSPRRPSSSPPRPLLMHPRHTRTLWQTCLHPKRSDPPAAWAVPAARTNKKVHANMQQHRGVSPPGTEECRQHGKYPLHPHSPLILNPRPTPPARQRSDSLPENFLYSQALSKPRHPTSPCQAGRGARREALIPPPHASSRLTPEA
jgi:hypothetical protein